MNDELAPSEMESPGRPRRGRTALFVAVPVGVLLLLLVLVLATRKPATDRQAESPLLNKPAPALVGQTIDGDRFDARTYEGRWLLVNFFATWCVPCVKEHPQLVRFSEDRGPEGTADANVVSVVFNDEAAEVRRFFEERGGAWPIVAPQDRIVTDWGVAGVPESYLVDPRGVVRVKLIGGVTAEGLNSLLAEARGAR